ncbi:MAG: hypothetical protein FJ106_05985 [Deltaproteobacteria bacterium]|nr:hypothetical protein [Deltaproteobacteria bacterium]
MSISSISPTANSDSVANSGKRKTSLNQEDFLNLFVTQLRNQNPLEPMDNFQMAAQMAQFSSLDSLNRIKSSLELMGAYQASMNSLQATGLIGKRVETESQSLSINGGKVSEGYYQLSKPGKVKVEIYDHKGQLIRTLEEGMKDVSRQKLVWDGNSQAGVKQPDGRYSFQVTAVDEKGQPIPVGLSRIDTVTGIHFENGVIYLNLGSEKITLQDVKAILSSSN